MELLIAFFIAIGLISSDTKDISAEKVTALQYEHHDKLVAEYGEKYTSIIVGTDESEKD